MLPALARDLRFTLRQFAARPGFTFTAVLVLALGLGANTAIFSVVNAILLRPLPYPQPGRLVSLAERARGRGGDESMGVAPANFLDWQRQAATFDQIAAFTTGSANLASPASAFDPERVEACYCSGNFLATLRVSPLLGRAFRSEEDRFDAPHVALISYTLWQRRLAGAADVVGKSMLIDGDRFEIVGVMPRGFDFPSDTVQVWTPLLNSLSPQLQIRHDLHFLAMIGRVRGGVPIERARAELNAIAARYKLEHPEIATGEGATVIPLHEALVQDAHTSLLILLGAVGCVLLIACVNVANLLLTRSSARARELCVRAAIGASRGQIVRQLLAESVLLSVAGGAAGLALAALIAPVLMAHAPGAGAIISARDYSTPPAVFLFAFFVALSTGIAAGLFPALQSSRIDLAAGLRENTRSSTAGRSHSRFRAVLVAAEVALSMVLLIAAGLLMHSFQRLSQVKPGMRIDHTLTLSLALPNTYKGPAERTAFYQEVSRRLQAVPGVDSVGVGSCPPVSGECNALFFYREDRPFTQGRFLVAREQSIDPHFLAATGIPLLRGRNFTERDGLGFDRNNPRPGTILTNEEMAREFFPGEDPLGKRIFFDFAVVQSALTGAVVPKYEIVGVIGDVTSSLEQKPQPRLYRPLFDGGYGNVTVFLHTRVAPGSVARIALQAIHQLDSSMAVYDVRTMEESLSHSAAGRQFTMLLFGSFAALALLLAAVGIYGVLSYAVTQRTAEIGIRIALGAAGSDVSRFILREGMRPTLAGAAIGLVAAFFTCRILKTLLFGIVPLDPLTFSLVPPLLLLVAALACYIPALRASRIDPTVALRDE